jgi:hypothetical protein
MYMGTMCQWGILPMDTGAESSPCTWRPHTPLDMETPCPWGVLPMDMGSPVHGEYSTCTWGFHVQGVSPHGHGVPCPWRVLHMDIGIPCPWGVLPMDMRPSTPHMHGAPCPQRGFIIPRSPFSKLEHTSEMRQEAMNRVTFPRVLLSMFAVEESRDVGASEVNCALIF